MKLDTSIPISSISYNGIDVPLFQEEPVLLWTNASPTSEFAAQTVTLATGYDAYLVEYREIYDTGGTTSSRPYLYYLEYVPFHTYQQDSNAGYIYRRLTAYNNSTYGYSRIIMNASDGSIQFGDAWRIESAYNASNYQCIPTRIFGIKWTISLGG